MQRKRHFTLIELLVVIAMIAILAAMLLPTLNRARLTARRIHCAGVLKQYNTAGQLYAANHNDFWIPPFNPLWYSLVEFRQLLGHGDTKFASSIEADNDRLPAGLLCPESNGVLNAVDGMGVVWRSYGVTYHLLADKNPTAATYAYKLPRLAAPSRAATWTDALDHIIYGLGTYSYAGENVTGGGRLAYRHGGLNTLNAGFFDGHVATINRNYIVKNTGWSNSCFNSNFYTR